MLDDYARHDTTTREHTALIREYYGYQDFNEPPLAFRLIRLLYARSWISNERPILMFDFATAWIIQNKIILPGESTWCRLIPEIRERTTKRLWKGLSSLPSDEQKLQGFACPLLKTATFFVSKVSFQMAKGIFSVSVILTTSDQIRSTCASSI